MPIGSQYICATELTYILVILQKKIVLDKRQFILKGQSHEIFDLCFFIKNLSLGYCFTLQSVFACNSKLTKIFEFKVDSAMSMLPLSQKSFLGQTLFFF
jgi:hypothetical protein